MIWTLIAAVFLFTFSFFVPQADAVLFDNSNGTVTDTRTGLIWQQAEPQGGGKTWSDALSYCNNLSLAGQTDWRLPNIKELESLSNDSLFNPAIDTTKFPSANAFYYWSSTTYAGEPYYAWTVYFVNGGIVNDGKDHNEYVRCVRSGQSGSLDYFAGLFRVGSFINFYPTLQGAYDQVISADIIEAQALVSTEVTLTFARDVSITLKGGYDSGFTSNPGFTTVNGTVTISGGTVTVENLIIK